MSQSILSNCPSILNNLSLSHWGRLEATKKAATSAELVRLSLRNFTTALRTARSIFPHDMIGVRSGYMASLIPSWALPKMTRFFTSVTLDKLEYYVLRSRQDKRVVGFTGLYAVRGKSEAWLGWFGVDSNTRGQGYGRALLAWTMQAAKGQGFETLRLWTTTAPEYVVANNLYRSMNFSVQDLGVSEIGHPENRILVYSVNLNGDEVIPFKGSLNEALLGATAKEIELMEKNMTPRDKQ